MLLLAQHRCWLSRFSAHTHLSSNIYHTARMFRRQQFSKLPWILVIWRDWHAHQWLLAWFQQIHGSFENCCLLNILAVWYILLDGWVCEAKRDSKHRCCANSNIYSKLNQHHKILLICNAALLAFIGPFGPIPYHKLTETSTKIVYKCCPYSRQHFWLPLLIEKLLSGLVDRLNPPL